MPKPILTVERFCKAVEQTVDRGYVYRLFLTPASERMRLPNDRRRFATIYWQAPSTSLWNPVQVVAMALYRRPSDPWPCDDLAAGQIGMPAELHRQIHRACYPYTGYIKSLRKDILLACGLW